MTDRPIDTKPQKIKFRIIGIVSACVIILILWMVFSPHPSQLNAKRTGMKLDRVSNGVFREYIIADATVMPLKTIFLDAVEGGRVAERYIDDGDVVTLGQPILKLVNTDLQLDFLQRETQAFDLINNLQNTKNLLEQNKVNKLQQLAEVDFQLKEATRIADVNEVLFQQKLISQAEYTQSRNAFEYHKRRKYLIEKSIIQDSITASEQMKQMRESYTRMKSNLELMRRKTEDLIVKAPAAGQISAFHAELGELKTKGQNLGQLDILNGYKVRAHIDEHYINRLVTGLYAVAEVGNKPYQLQIRNIYPQVVNGHFETDLFFTNAIPQHIRKGLNIQVQLELGQSENALLIPKGGFYQTTGGNWIYVLDTTGNKALKRTIKIGRQNPEYFEVIEGLKEGEQVITSSYETLGDFDQINLN